MKERIINCIKQFLKLYVIVYGFTMMATTLFMAIFHYQIITITFMVYALIFTFIALLPVIPLMLINGENLSVKQTMLLYFGLFAFNEITLMPAGYFFGMWRNWKEGLLMFVVILAVNYGTQLVAYGKNALLSNQINARLKELQEQDLDQDQDQE